MLASKGEHFSRGGREVEMDEEFGVVGGFMADDGDWASPGLTDKGDACFAGICRFYGAVRLFRELL